MVIIGLFGHHDINLNLLKEVIIFSAIISELTKNKRDLENDDFRARKLPRRRIHVFLHAAGFNFDWGKSRPLCRQGHKNPVKLSARLQISGFTTSERALHF